MAGATFCETCEFDFETRDTTRAVALARREARTAKRWLVACAICVGALALTSLVGALANAALDGLFVLFACTVPFTPAIAILAGRDLARANRRLRRANNMLGLPEARVIAR